MMISTEEYISNDLLAPPSFTLLGNKGQSEVIQNNICSYLSMIVFNKGNNKITELRTILQRENQNS